MANVVGQVSRVFPIRQRMFSGSQEYCNRTVIVTGGGQGIGRSIALAFAQEAADVVVVDIEPEKTGPCKEATDARFQGTVHHIQGDVSDPELAQQVVDYSVSKFGGVDILVNNVSIQPDNGVPLHEVSFESWRRVNDVNVNSIFHFSKAVIPHMLIASSGNIVNIASIQGLQSQPGVPAYAASKGAALSLTRQMAVEYADKGIRVNAICPGTVATPLVEKMLRERGLNLEQAGTSCPMKRVGAPAEIAQLALFLASTRAGFITGSHFVADGGLMALGSWSEHA